MNSTTPQKPIVDNSVIISAKRKLQATLKIIAMTTTEAVTWASIKKTAQTYQDVVKHAKQEAALKAKKATEQQQAETQRQFDQNQQKLSGIFESLEVVDALKAIQQEVWHAGEVSTSASQSADGFRLTAQLGFYHEIPRLDWLGEHDKQVSLRMNKPFSKYYLSGIAATAVLDTVKDTTRLRVQNQNLVEYANKPLDRKDIARHIQERGLRYGLQTYLQKMISSPEPKYFSFDPTGDYAREKFADALIKVVDERSISGSTPSLIQQWNEEFIALFPSALKEKGILTETELRPWAHDLVGSSWLKRRFDGFLGYNTI